MKDPNVIRAVGFLMFLIGLVAGALLSAVLP